MSQSSGTDPVSRGIEALARGEVESVSIYSREPMSAERMTEYTRQFHAQRSDSEARHKDMAFVHGLRPIPTGGVKKEEEQKKKEKKEKDEEDYIKKKTDEALEIGLDRINRERGPYVRKIGLNKVKTERKADVKGEGMGANVKQEHIYGIGAVPTLRRVGDMHGFRWAERSFGREYVEVDPDMASDAENAFVADRMNNIVVNKATDRFCWVYQKINSSSALMSSLCPDVNLHLPILLYPLSERGDWIVDRAFYVVANGVAENRPSSRPTSVSYVILRTDTP